MTDLLNRPSATSSSRRPARRSLGELVERLFRLLAGRPASGSGEREGRLLTVSAALAAFGAVATALVTCMGLAVIGWFLADAGAHGQTTDALRVGANVWLVGHGSQVDLGGVPLGIVPLGVTAVIALVIHRCGRWAAATSQPAEDDRTLALAATIFTGLYVVLTVVTCVLVSTDSASPGLGRAILGSLLLSGIAGTLGMAAGTGRLQAWLELVPGWARSTVRGAWTSFLALLAAAGLLLLVALVLGLGRAATVMSGLQLSPGDYVMYGVAMLAVAPNAVLLGSAYLLGPGFAVGTGTVVSPSVVALGPVPAFPLLAALPQSGPTPPWVIVLLAVPVLATVLGAVRAQRAYGVTAYDSAALRGFGAGTGAALLTTLAIALAGGPMGTGRMADIGAPMGEVLVAALMAMGLGGLVAGVATAWWQRRGTDA